MAALPFFLASAILAASVPVASGALPGRAEDGRVAGIAWQLATAGAARCPRLEPASAMVLQHLLQFHPADRAGVVARLPLDRGPGVIAVVSGGPADRAGIRPGDVLLALDGVALPPEPGLDLPFDAARAHVRADTVADRLQAARAVTLLRDGATLDLAIAPRPACPSRVHLARSAQRNAYADGRHVFLTTGVLPLLYNDDELAFMLAHELAHNVLGHAATMRSGTVKGRAGVRAIENAADRLGGELMLDAGYDPVRGAALLRRIGGGDVGIALFASHEPVGRRIAALEALVAARRTP